MIALVLTLACAVAPPPADWTACAYEPDRFMTYPVLYLPADEPGGQGIDVPAIVCAAVWTCNEGYQTEGETYPREEFAAVHCDHCDHANGAHLSFGYDPAWPDPASCGWDMTGDLVYPDDFVGWLDSPAMALRDARARAR